MRFLLSSEGPAEESPPMNASVTVKKAITQDVLTGLLALVALMLLLVIGGFDNDLRFFTIASAVVFGTAAFLRATKPPSRAWTKGVLVTTGGAVPVVLMSVTHAAFTSPVFVIVFVLVALPATMVGAWVRHLWARGSRKWALTELLLGSGAVVLIALTVIPTVAARMFTQRIDRAAPSFSLSADGRTLTSSELKGKVTVLVFWATWCTPCNAEMPKIERVMLRYRDDPQVVFWAVNPGWGGDTDDKARSVARERKWSIPLAFDNGRAANAFGITGLPTFVILDKEGHVRLVHNGYDAADDIQATISQNVGSLL